MSTSVSRAAAGPGEQAVTAERCAAQLLCGEPARSAAEVARRLLAIQAQDPRGARLTIRVRSAGVSASEVDAALASRGTQLAVASDLRSGRPGSADEAAGGDGAAALLVGSEGAEEAGPPLLAALIGRSSTTEEFLDR